MGQDLWFKAETELQSHRDRVARWNRAIFEGSNQAVARQYYEEIQGLESKCAAAEIALNTCKFSPPEDEGLADKLEGALTDLREAIDSFRDRFLGGEDEA